MTVRALAGFPVSFEMYAARLYRDVYYSAIVFYSYGLDGWNGSDLLPFLSDGLSRGKGAPWTREEKPRKKRTTVALPNRLNRLPG